MPPSQLDWDRYYGTLVANMNSQLDMEYEQFWHALRTSKLNQTLINSTTFQINTASLQLQNDLVGLLDTIISSQNISLTDVLGLLGYGNIFEINNMKSKTEVSNVNNIKCSSFDESFQSTCKSLKSLNILHPLHGFDPMHIKRTTCDLGRYLEHWNEYFYKLGMNRQIILK